MASATLLVALLAPATRGSGSPTATLATGTVTVVGPATCPSSMTGATCTKIKVTGCSGVASIQGTIATALPSGGVPPVGVVFLFSGANGQAWWNSGTGIAATFLSKLRETYHLETVQLKWSTDWTKAVSGQLTGLAALACRPASVVKYVHDAIYATITPAPTPAPGQCGFCVTGNSGGASQTMYPLTHYGLASLAGVNAAVPTSGPTHGDLRKGCLGGTPADPNDAAYAYGGDVSPMDYPYGYLDPLNNPGPCLQHDPSWSSHWDIDSVATQGTSYNYADTRVEFVIGSADSFVETDNQAGDVCRKLTTSSSPSVTWTLVSGMVHTIQRSQVGLNALETALTGRVWPGPLTPCPSA